MLAEWSVRPRRRRSIVATIAAAGLIGAAWSEARIWPHHIAYFNLLAGGASPTGPAAAYARCIKTSATH